MFLRMTKLTREAEPTRPWRVAGSSVGTQGVAFRFGNNALASLRLCAFALNSYVPGPRVDSLRRIASARSRLAKDPALP